MKNVYTPRELKTFSSYTTNDNSISPNSIYYADISDKYEVYDYAEITNLNTDNDCTIIINGSLQIPLPKGNQYTLKQPFRSIAILNNGSTSINANELKINYTHNSKQSKVVSTLAIASRFI